MRVLLAVATMMGGAPALAQSPIPNDPFLSAPPPRPRAPQAAQPAPVQAAPPGRPPQAQTSPTAAASAPNPDQMRQAIAELRGQLAAHVRPLITNELGCDRTFRDCTKGSNRWVTITEIVLDETYMRVTSRTSGQEVLPANDLVPSAMTTVRPERINVARPIAWRDVIFIIPFCNNWPPRRDDILGGFWRRFGDDETITGFNCYIRIGGHQGEATVTSLQSSQARNLAEQIHNIVQMSGGSARLDPLRSFP